MTLQSKVYAVMEYDQSLQYINRHYFRTKIKGDEHYDIIFNIITLMGFLPLALWIVFMVLSVGYIYPKLKLLLPRLKEVEVLMKKLKKAEDKDIEVKKVPVDDENENDNRDVYLVELKSDVYKSELSEMARTNGAYVRKVNIKVKNEDNKYMIDLSASSKWKVKEEIPLLCLSIFLNGTLFALHILSALDLIKYGNDVLLSDQDLNVVTITFSLFVVVITYILAVGRSVYGYYQGGSDSRSSVVAAKSVKVKALNFRKLAAMSITVNAVHLGCYFLPYMLLAFIYNPLQTCFTYLGLGLLIICIYLLFLIFTYCCTSICTKFSDSSTHDFLGFYKTCTPSYRKTIKPLFSCMGYFLLSLGILLVTIYFSAVIIYVLTLGSLNDFEVIQNLVPPLLIGVLTYAVVKPTYKQAKQVINLDDESRIEKFLKNHKENTKEATESHA